VKKQVLCISLGIIVILFSTPLAYKSVNVLYSNKNLVGEYVPILDGFIHSFMLIGTLIFSLGLLSILRDKNL
jgi:hypothetical protein